jgi:hypothetical protein
MWNRQPISAVLATSLLASCATTPAQDEFAGANAAIQLPEESVPLMNPETLRQCEGFPLPKEKQGKGAFQVSYTGQAGVFQAFLRNDECLFSGELNGKLKTILHAYCGTEATLQSEVVVVSDERWPPAYAEYKFRCEASQQ